MSHFCPTCHRRQEVEKENGRSYCYRCGNETPLSKFMRDLYDN